MKNHNIPVARVDGSNAGGGVSLQGLAPRGVAGGGCRQASSRGKVAYHGGQVVEVGVAVTEEENLLVWIVMPYRTFIRVTSENLG